MHLEFDDGLEGDVDLPSYREGADFRSFGRPVVLQAIYVGGRNTRLAERSRYRPRASFLKHINDGGTSDGGIDMDGRALTGKVIDDGQTTEATSTRELIVDEVHRPTLVGRSG